MLDAVYMPGCWDLLHVGHIRAIYKASRLASSMIVGVADDNVVKQDKGHSPIVPLEQRIEMLEALWFVDSAFAYHELEFLTHLNMFQPSVMAVSESWGNDYRHHDAEYWCRDREVPLIKIPYTDDVSTSKIKRRVIIESLEVPQ